MATLAELGFKVDTSSVKDASSTLQAMAIDARKAEKSSLELEAASQKLNKINKDLVVSEAKVLSITKSLDSETDEAKRATLEYALAREKSRIADNNATKAATELRMATAASGANTRVMADAANDSSAALGQFGRKAGQAAGQVQQLVGQIHGGQNVFGAVSAQATDLGFVLGYPLLGAVVGIAAAFSGPLFSALVGTGQNAEDLTDQIDELTDGLKNATYAQAEFIRIQNSEKIREQKKAIEDAKKQLSEYTKEMNVLLERTGGFGLRATELNNLMTKQQAIIDTAKMAIADYSEKSDKAAIIQKDHVAAIEKINAALKEELATIGATTAEVLRYRLEKEGATEKEIEAALAMQTSIDARKKQIETDKEAIKYTKALAVAYGNQGVTAQAAALKNIEALELSQRTREQVLSDGLAREKAIIASGLAEGVISVDQANAMKLASDKNYADQKRQLDMQTNTAALGASAAFLGNMAAIAQAGGEDQFETWKRLAQAQAAVSAALAITNALSSAPAPFNIALAGSIGALAAVQIAQIEQQQFTARELGGQVQAGQTVMVGERGPELITMGSMGGQVTSNKNLQQQSSPTIVLQVSTGVTSTVRAEMASMMPFITKSLMTAMRAR